MQISTILALSASLVSAATEKTFACDKLIEWKETTYSRNPSICANQCIRVFIVFGIRRQMCIPCTHRAFYLRITGPNDIPEIEPDSAVSAVQSCATQAAGASAIVGIAATIPTAGSEVLQPALSAYIPAFDGCLASAGPWTSEVLSQFNISVVKDSWRDGDQHSNGTVCNF